MKKLFLFLLFFLAFGFVLFSCAAEKKSKKTPVSAITVEVSPSSIGQVSSGTVYNLTATVKNNGVLIENAQVSWTVTPSSFGACSPNQSSSTVFTPDMNAVGQGFIKASYNGTESSPISFSIQEAIVVIDSVEINPAGNQAIYSTDTIKFTATAKAGSTAYTGSAYQIHWTATGGTVSPTVSNSGDEVTFTPNIQSGDATIKASYGAINSATVNIAVGSDTPAPNIRMIYKDSYLDESVNSSFMTYSDKDWGGNSKVTLSDSTGITIDPNASLKIAYTRGTTELANNYAGVAIAFKSPQDLSAYSKMKVWLKGEVGGEKITIKPCDNDCPATTLTETWTEYTYAISNLTPVSNAINIVFEDKVTGKTNATIYMDYLYFEE